MAVEFPFRNTSTWIESAQFDWTPFYAYGQEIQIAKDVYLFHEGDAAEYVYVVLQGRIRLCQLSQTGEEKAVLVVGLNGLVGEIGVMQPNGYVTSAVAASDSVLLRLPEHVFRDLFHSSPQLAEFVWLCISYKFMLLSRQVTDLSYATAQYRVVRYLIELAETYGETSGDAVTIRIQFTQQEMANLAGTTRVTVAQVFRKLEQMRLFRRDGDCFRIASLDALRQLTVNPKSSHVS